MVQVLVVENEQGEVVREFMKDTDAINMYKNMRETLGEWFLVSGNKVIVTHLCLTDNSAEIKFQLSSYDDC